MSDIPTSTVSALAPVSSPPSPPRPRREPLLTWIAGFVDLFVWLLVLKSFFLPLFIIPTGSMAQTLAGAYADHTCPNCGWAYEVGVHETPHPPIPPLPILIQCPNCRYVQQTASVSPTGVKLKPKSGDRIVLHGWMYDWGAPFSAKRWDVVVFKNPNQPEENYIKRLIGIPGDTIEVIDGDIFVTPKGESEPRISRKTRFAQCALWIPYYDHDYLPRGEGREGRNYYKPRWEARATADAWKELDSRAPRFDGLAAPRAEIQFVTGPKGSDRPGLIQDINGYNAYHGYDTVPPPEIVTDVRLSADVEFAAGDGYVELQISKYDNLFAARLYRDGRLSLTRTTGDGQTQEWGSANVSVSQRPVTLSIGHADYQVVVEFDGRRALVSSPEHYSVKAAAVRGRGRLAASPTARVAAEKAQLTLHHLKIDRDVHYTSRTVNNFPGRGIEGTPVKLRDDEYFCMGDNSPASHDGRWWRADDLGPHLRARYERGEYTVGTVPADQMVGPAFLVYWPGFMPLLPSGPNLLPDLGRVRWIR